MRNSRQALAPGTELMLGAGVAGRIYTIIKEIGRGASCIVYLASYKNTLDEKKSVYIKECYPHSLNIKRRPDGDLFTEDADGFGDHKNRFRESFSICNRIYETEGLVNATSNYLDVFEKNNTLYTVIARAEGQTLSDIGIEDISLKKLIRIFISTAKTVKKIHDEGYLYLDLKPENIYVLKDMNESIQLIDYDSMIPIRTSGDMLKYRISYSKGFAPMELREGRLDKLGKYSDVYGIGATLFYQIFDRSPDAMDTDPFAEYDFAKSTYPIDTYRDRFFYKLSDFFRKTIAVIPEDRYSDMSYVIEALEDIEPDADTMIAYVRESYYPVRSEVIGRESEIGQICDFINSKNKCLFIYGMGGIGKSTVVRTALDTKKDEIDTVAYIYFRDSLIETICDDRQLSVNTVEKMLEETTEEYFDRKLKNIKNITSKTSTILVIDNFSGELGEAFAQIREAFPQIIMISRDNPEVDDDSVIQVKELSDDDCERLFYRYLTDCPCSVLTTGSIGTLTSSSTDDDKQFISQIIKNICSHTLAIEVIAKQVKKGLLSLQKAVEITAKAGFAEKTDGSVAFARDGIHKHKALLQILQDIFAVDNLAPTEIAVLQMLQMFNSPGINSDIYARLCGGSSENYRTDDIINDLISSGWISKSDDIISIHPVIGEVICRVAWADASIDLAKSVMKNLPEFAGEYTLQILKAVSGIIPARRTDEYYALQWGWTSDVRRDEEEFITDIYGRIEEAFLYSDPMELIDGADFVCFVLEEIKDFDSAANMVEILGEYFYDLGDDYLIAKYESTRTQLFDSALNGGYADSSRYARKLQKWMLESTKIAIKHMRVVASSFYGKNKKSDLNIDSRKKDSLLLLITYMLEYLVFMIRGYRGTKKQAEKIRDNLDRVTKLILTAEKKYSRKSDVKTHAQFNTMISEKSTNNDLSTILCTYYLTIGWYHTMVDIDRDKVKATIDKLHEIQAPTKTRLDYIDFDIVPCAEMLYRMGFVTESRDMLLKGVAICDEYDDIEPYVRKKAELEEHIVDVSM